MTTSNAQFISIPEWGRRMGVSKDSAYRAARLGQIPGCFAIGRLYRVTWSAFVERSGLAGGQQPAEEVSGVMVAPVDHVGVYPQGGRRVGVTETAGDGPHVRASSDQERGTHVP